MSPQWLVSFDHFLQLAFYNDPEAGCTGQEKRKRMMNPFESNLFWVLNIRVLVPGHGVAKSNIQTPLSKQQLTTETE